MIKSTSLKAGIGGVATMTAWLFVFRGATCIFAASAMFLRSEWILSAARYMLNASLFQIDIQRLLVECLLNFAAGVLCFGIGRSIGFR